MESLVIVLGLLTIGIIALVAVVVWRDRRELKYNQVLKDIARVEEEIKEFNQTKHELEKMLTSSRRHNDGAVVQLESQIKQIKNTLTQIEQRLPLTVVNGDKREPAKERNHKQGKGRSNRNRDNRTREGNDRTGSGEVVKINDGEKYAKIYEMAGKGLNAQEIASKMSIGQEEVELVLELKGKKMS